MTGAWDGPDVPDPPDVDPAAALAERPLRAEAMDAELRTVVDAIAEHGYPEWHEMDVPTARRVEDEAFSGAASTPVAAVADRTVPGPEPSPRDPDPPAEVPVRVITPETARPTGRLPVLVFAHGGGWTLGTLDSVEPVCRELAHRTPAVVVAVDYRLAPEHPFPAALRDVVAVYRWVRQGTEVVGGDCHRAVGGDSERVAVGGTSAGGNLAAATCLYAREASLTPPDHQLLAYPMTDPAGEWPSYGDNADGPLLTARDVAWFWAKYLEESRANDPDGTDPLAAVCRADHRDLPPATVTTAGFDPVRDDGLAYAAALELAGVPVDTLHFPALCHGFCSLTDDVSRAATATGRVANSLARGLEVRETE